MSRLLLLLAVLIGQMASAQGRFDRYALILEDPPLARQMAQAQKDGRRLAAGDRMLKVEAAQSNLRKALAARNIAVTGSTQLLLNAVYVFAPGEQAAALASLPGVVRVEKMRPWKRQMDRALDLVRAREAWNQVGGPDNAGAGVKIAILDTGIDQTHPAFQDASLNPPEGYPKCAGDDCAYTNNKVIVARSYVRSLVLPDQPAFSRPDDLSPRDRVGHGTATAMVAAGVATTGPSGTVSGVAPKAFLGNYKIFGSPGVNDVTFDDVIIQALEDAAADQMDIALLPAGLPALWGPSDKGETCNLPGAEACDARVEAVQNAAAAGLTVVVSAGNDGDLGVKFPALNSIYTPGTAPAAITVGATTNSHIFFSSVQVPGGGSGLNWIPALFGDGPKPASELTAPLRDVAAQEPDGKACRALGAGTLTGAIALIERGDCAFATKVNYAQQAGAVGAIIMQSEGSDFIFPMTGMIETGIPAVMIGATDGAALRAFVQSNPDPTVILDPKLEPLDAQFDTVAYFSSRGPNIGDSAIKPELVAVGTDLYMATQNYDPNGDMWNPDRYTNAQGTSFAAPMVAGAAALVKQLNPGFSPAQVKSALVNTATGGLTDFDENGASIPASVTAVGAGKLNVAGAIKATVTAQPATLSFGIVGPGTLPAIGLVLTNTGNSRVDLGLSIEPPDPNLALGTTALSLDPGQSSGPIPVTVTQLPDPGSYEGFVVVTGGPTPLRVPYLYLRGDGVPFNALPLSGFDFVGNVNETVPGDLLFKVVDRYGVPVPSLSAQIEPRGQVDVAWDPTDQLGIGGARVFLGPNPGEQEFTASFQQAPDLTVHFPGRARLRPAINEGGVVNAASGELGRGLAPGSYISIYGTSLSEALRVFSTPYLPLSLAGVSVSFDIPEQGISEPGHLHFVSPGQINVQIPWELQGRTTAWMKVSIGPVTESSLYSVALNDYSPAFFEKQDIGGSGRVVIAARNAVTGQEISSANPALRGEYVSLYANGLGPVDNPPPSGEITPRDPLAQTLQQPAVTIGGQQAEVQFSGLAPYFVGLYQVNVVVPQGLDPGLYEVVITIGGVSSKAGLLYVG